MRFWCDFCERDKMLISYVKFPQQRIFLFLNALDIKIAASKTLSLDYLLLLDLFKGIWGLWFLEKKKCKFFQWNFLRIYFLNKILIAKVTSFVISIFSGLQRFDPTLIIFQIVIEIVNLTETQTVMSEENNTLEMDKFITTKPQLSISQDCEWCFQFDLENNYSLIVMAVLRSRELQSKNPWNWGRLTRSLK